MVDHGADAELIRQSGLFDADWYLVAYPDVVESGLDPLQNYLRFGARIERNPGPAFDTGFYLRQYPEIARAGINPLVHYLRHGREEGRQAMPVASPAAAQPASSALRLGPRAAGEDRVLVMCSLPEHDPVHDAIVGLAAALAARGMRCVAAGDSVPLMAMAGIGLLRLPFQLSHYGLHGDWSQGEHPTPEWLDDVIAAERRWLQWNGGDASDQRALADACVAAWRFWRTLLFEARPAFVLAWGSTSPLSRLQLGVCADLGLPCLVLERGHFPGTLSLDLLGQFGHGAATLRPHALLVEHQRDDTKRWQALVDWQRSSGRTAYAASNAGFDVVSLRRQLLRLGGKVHLYIGSNDLGSGCAFAPSETRQCHPRVAESSREAARHVLDALRAVDPQAVLLIKPHPSDRDDYSALAGDRVLPVTGLDLGALIGLADVCISLSTTAFATCVLEGKPIVSLALSDVTGKGVAYECSSLVDLPVMLRAAAAGDDRARRDANGRRYLQQLFDEQLVGLDRSVPTRLRVPDLADYLRRHLDGVGRRHPGDARRFDEVLADLAGTSGAMQYFPLRGEPAPAPARPVCVVVALSAGKDAARASIESVLRARCNVEWRLLVVDCDGPREGIEVLMAQYSGLPKVTVLGQGGGLSVTAATNRALLVAGDMDVVVLGPGAQVPDHWLERLQAPVLADPEVATVSPSRGQAPAPGLPAGPGAPATDAGCVYFNRHGLAKAGYLEEGDGPFERSLSTYCDRTLRLGFRHVCAADLILPQGPAAGAGQDLPSPAAPAAADPLAMPRDAPSRALPPD